MIRDVLRRWNERRKLAKGRCQYCDAVLRDDETSPWCSTACADEWTSANAY